MIPSAGKRAPGYHFVRGCIRNKDNMLHDQHFEKRNSITKQEAMGVGSAGSEIQSLVGEWQQFHFGRGTVCTANLEL